MSSLARNRPLTLQGVACLWLGQQAVMSVAAVAVDGDEWGMASDSLSPCSATWAATTKSLNWTQTTKSLNWLHHLWHSGPERSGCLTPDHPV